MPLIFSTHDLHPDVTAMLEHKASYRVASSPTAEAIMAEGTDADAIIVRANIPPAYFEAASNLRAAVRHGAGLDMVPMDAASGAGVLVANVPGANARTVAEQVIFGALALLRQYRKVDRDLRKDGWEAGRRHSNSNRDLSGRTIGVVGFGNIGREIFQIAHNGFGLTVIASTRSPQNLPDKVRAVSIDQLVEDSDIVVLCCPLNDQTFGLLNGERIGRMKPDAVLVNVSRGPVVEEASLIAALQEGRIAGAALDVFDIQPLPKSHPYFELDNVILTPHMAGITLESMLRLGTVAAEETIRILDGELPVNLCNPQAVDLYRQRFPN